MVNDALFGDIKQSEFRLLADIARRLVAGGERAVLLSRLDRMGQHDEETRGG